MSSFFQTILIVIGSIASIGILAGGIGYFVQSFRKGSRSEKSEVVSSSQEIINFWKSNSENLQIILDRKETEWNGKFQALTKELGELKGQLNAEKAQNDRLEKIFQNRNPESDDFMKFMVEAARQQQAVNQDILRILQEIHSLSIEEHNREMKVETKISKQ